MPKKRKVSRKVSRLKLKSAPRKQKSRGYVYNFGDGKADGDGSMKPLLGGKGANLAEMKRIGLPVPTGFSITTEVCTYIYAQTRHYPSSLPGDIERSNTHM